MTKRIIDLQADLIKPHIQLVALFFDLIKLLLKDFCLFFKLLQRLLQSLPLFFLQLKRLSLLLLFEAQLLEKSFMFGQLCIFVFMPVG